MKKMTKENATRIKKMVNAFATESLSGDVEYKIFGHRIQVLGFRKDLAIRRMPLLKKIEGIPFKIWTAAQDIGYQYDLRKSEIEEVELACYVIYWNYLTRKDRFLMAAVTEGKIRIDQLDEEQLLEFLTFPNYNIYLSLGHGNEAPAYIKRLFDEEPKEEPVEKPKSKKVKKIQTLEDLEKACEEPVKKEDLLATEKKSILDEKDPEIKFV